MSTVKTKWYELTQNNSGGIVDINDFVSLSVFIEAIDEDHMFERFRKAGIFENSSYDCPCCGDRWNPEFVHEDDSFETLEGAILESYNRPNQEVKPYLYNRITEDDKHWAVVYPIESEKYKLYVEEVSNSN